MGIVKVLVSAVSRAKFRTSNSFEDTQHAASLLQGSDEVMSVCQCEYSAENDQIEEGFVTQYLNVRATSENS